MVNDGYIQYGLDCHKVLTPNQGHLTTIFCMCGTPYDHTYTEGNVLTDNSACVFGCIYSLTKHVVTLYCTQNKGWIIILP